MRLEMTVDDLQAIILHHSNVAVHLRHIVATDDLTEQRKHFNAVAAQHEATAKHYQSLIERLKKEEKAKVNTRNTLFSILLVIVVLFASLGGVTNAQEMTETPEPEITIEEPGTVEATEAVPVPPPDDVVVVEEPVLVPDYSVALPYATVVGMAVIIAFVVLARTAIMQAAAQSPRWTTDAIFATLQEITKALNNEAKKSTTPLDDLAVTELNRIVAELKTDIDNLRNRLEDGITLHSSS